MLKSLGIFLAFLGGTPNAFSQEKCASVLLSEAAMVQQAASENILTAANVAEHRETLTAQAHAIFLQNMTALLQKKWGTFGHLPKAERDRLMNVFRPHTLRADLEAGRLQIAIQEEKLLSTTHLHFFKVDLLRGSQSQLQFAIQSNGRVSFLAESYKYRGGRQMKYKGVAWTERGEQLFDLGDVVLESLPAEVPLSRVLSEGERTLWLQGALPHLGSGHFNKKTHFALNFYGFTAKTPYQVKVPKEVLLELYQKNFLEINSYEVKEINPDFGMPAAAQTSFGLNVEVVFLKEALPQLQPFMAESLKQGILPFGADSLR